jgi:hypothetical protein
MQNLREAELELQISLLSVELAKVKLNKLAHHVHQIKEGDEVRVGPGSKCHMDRRGTIIRLTDKFALVLDDQTKKQFKVAQRNCIKL